MIYSTHIYTLNTMVRVRVKYKNTRAAERRSVLLGVCERAQGSIDRYVLARTRVCVCVCAWTTAPGIAPPLHHRSNATGAKASGERTSARAGWLADEIWQQRFCFRHGFNVHRHRTYTANRTTGSGYIYYYYNM